jgi:hypothetical protein
MEFPCTQERLQEILDETGLADEITVQAAYSGRGMYGKKCIAFTAAQSRTVTKLWILLAGSCAEVSDPADLMDIVDREQKDNWGHEVIVYYPDVSFPKAEEEDPEDPEEYDARLNALRGIN